MNWRLKLTILLLLAVTTSIIFAGGVLAQGDPDLTDPAVVEALLDRIADADDPGQAFSQLTPEEQAAVRSALTVVSHEVIEADPGPASTALTPGVAPSPGTPRCYQNSHAMLGKNIFRQVLYELKSDTRWCSDGIVITMPPAVMISGRTPALFWEYVGNINQVQSGGQGYPFHTDYVQGHFRLCLPRVACAKHSYPSITKQQYANGRRTSWGAH